MKLIARSSLIIAAFFALDKVAGLARQILIARVFGLTYQIDVFNAANNIPDLLSALISGGALGVALIPVLKETLDQKGSSQAWDLFSQVINLAFLVTAGFSILIGIFARPLVHVIIAPGFPAPQQALTVQVMRLDLIAILIFSISGLVMAGLQTNQHFLLPAMAPVLYNLGQIFGVAFLAPVRGINLGPMHIPGLGMGVYGLVAGTIIGALLHLAIQIPGLICYKFHWKIRIDWRDPMLVQVLSLLGPRVVTMFFLQLFFIINDHLASQLGEGSVTALTVGWFIMQVPETLIGTAIAIAILPTLAGLFASGDVAAYGKTINQAVRVIIALTLPAAALLSVALQPLVQAIWRFPPQGIELVVWVTRAYLLGLTGHSLLEIASRSFYAQKDARTPLFAAALNAGVFILFAATLSKRLGAPGIALANIISFTGEALLLLILLNRKTPGVLKVSFTLVRVLLVCVAGSIVVIALMHLPIPVFLAALAALAVGGLCVIPFIWPEIKLLVRL